MKRILFVLIAVLSCVAANAQKWEVTKHEADDLKGTEAYTSYMFSEPGVGSFVFWSNHDGHYRLISDDGIFNYERIASQFGAYRGEDVIVGLYDNDNNLVERIEMWLDCESDKPTFLETRDAGKFLNPTGQAKKVKKIMKHLNSGKGYIRFVAARYGKTDFDLKVPCEGLNK